MTHQAASGQRLLVCTLRRRTRPPRGEASLCVRVLNTLEGARADGRPSVDGVDPAVKPS